MQLIVISEDTLKKEETIHLVNMFEQGLMTFHLRKTQASLQEVESFILSIPELYHHRIVLHQHYQLADDYGIKGIHFKEKEKILHSNDLYRKDLTISTSFHDLENLKINKEVYDYVFFSPVFPSISKSDYFPSFSLSQIKQALPEINQMVFALGGIQKKNIQRIKSIGFSGAAVLGAVWQSSNPLKEFIELKTLLELS